MSLGATTGAKEFDLSAVSAGLAELCNASTMEKGRLLDQLVPSSNGMSIQTRGVTYHGRAIAYQLLDFVSGEPVRRKASLEALRKLQQSYAETLPQLVDHHALYTQYLKDRAQGLRPDETPVRETRRALSAFNEMRSVVRGLSFQEVLNKADETFRRAFDEAGEKPYSGGVLRKPVYFAYDPTFDRAKECQRIIDLEGPFNEPMPVDAFVALSNRQSLDNEQVQAVQEWVAKVKRRGLSVNTLHNGLKALFDKLGLRTQCTPVAPSSLAVLEACLQAFGVDFEQPDDEHIQWRNGLEQTKELQCGESVYKLKNRLGQHKGDFDRHVGFSVESDPSCVVRVGCNEAILGIQRAHLHDLLPLASILRMDGRCCVMEALVPLNKVAWKSTETSVDPSELGAVHDLAAFLSKVAQRPQTPLFTSKDVGFGQNRTLKAIRTFSPGPKRDFDRLVSFACECANGKASIFREILRKSGLSDDPCCRFYAKVVEDALKTTGSRGVDEVAAALNISDAGLRKQAERLRSDVVQLRDDLITQLFNVYHLTADRKEVERNVGQAVSLAYADSIGAGILMPNLKSDVMHRVLSLSRPSMREEEVQRLWPDIAKARKKLGLMDFSWHQSSFWERYGIHNAEQQQVLINK